MSKKSKKSKVKNGFPERIYVTIENADSADNYLLGYRDFEKVEVPQDEKSVTVGVYELVSTNIVKITKTIE